MATRKKRPGLGEALVKGALAGLLGGTAMLVAEKLAERRVLSRAGSAHRQWERLAAAVAGGRVRSLSGRRRAFAGVGMQMAYSALLGALYGVTQGRASLSLPLQRFLQDGLMYAAFLSSRGFERKRPVRRRLARPGATRGLLPVTTDAVFAAATAYSFKALANGRRK
jgi:hypothetical protein